MTTDDEHRPAPSWVGDVGLGVQAWVGDTSPTPGPTPGRTPGATSSEAPRPKKGRGGRRSRTRTPAEREEARAATAAARAAEVEADPEAVGRTILLDALTGQARTRKELADKLAKRDVPDEVAAELLDRFTDVGLIDDATFAQQWVESRHRSRGLAPRALAQELRRKGVGDEETKAALEQIGEGDQRAAARELVDKKLRSMRGLDPQVATRRLAGLLARKGYGAGIAFSVVREALADGDDEHVIDAIEMPED
ncbi:regulatory protein RecX [Nocardioides sp.]|uniref:regulatory protein RecX n=1 Tax=Nocardioides sp. TaxID=35761 RepID=UPI002602B4BC|nr:regulatory protein RecX [Nocardioides sp.]MCW2738034.1 Regulatory protein RecX [Nocardioides sp.]